MKKIITIAIIALASSVIASAKAFNAPEQVDTMIIHCMTYNGTTIKKENWPADCVLLTPTSITLGKKTVKIKALKGAKYDQKSEWYGEYDTQTFTLAGKGELFILRLNPSAKCYPMTGIGFDGYVIMAYEKCREAEYQNMLSRRHPQETRY